MNVQCALNVLWRASRSLLIPTLHCLQQHHVIASCIMYVSSYWLAALVYQEHLWGEVLRQLDCKLCFILHNLISWLELHSFDFKDYRIWRVLADCLWLACERHVVSCKRLILRRLRFWAIPHSCKTVLQVDEDSPYTAKEHGVCQQCGRVEFEFLSGTATCRTCHTFAKVPLDCTCFAHV